MTGTLEPHVTPTSRRRRWLAPVLAAVAAVAAIGIGVGVGLAVAGRNDPPASLTATGQLADVRAACTAWLHDQSPGRATAGWCDEMSDWMGRQMADGSMSGPMMWGSSDRMLATCRAWMDATAPPGATAEWCDDMSRAMWPDLGDGGNGPMGGPMMGG
jgi:hypothetical protein